MAAGLRERHLGIPKQSVPATNDDISRFSNQRQFASFLGIVPVMKASGDDCYVGDEAFGRILSQFLNSAKTKLWVMDRRMLTSMVCCHPTSIILGVGSCSLYNEGPAETQELIMVQRAYAFSFLFAQWLEKS
jgi:hypothetical protein